MSFRPSDVISRVRFLLADDFTTERFSDADMLVMVKDALDQIVLRTPMANAKVGELTLPAGNFFTVADVQDAADTSREITAVFEIIADNTLGSTQAIRTYDRPMLDAQLADWYGSVEYLAGDTVLPTSGDTHAKNSTRVRYYMPEDTRSFFVYPAAGADHKVIAKYAVIHDALADVDADIEYSLQYLSPVADYVASRLLLRDAESAPALSQLASGYMQSFTEQITKIAGVA